MSLLVLVAVTTYILTRSRPADAKAPKITSLAVLPLKNLSGDPAQEYFADGMTEEVIGRLSMIRGPSCYFPHIGDAIQGHPALGAGDCSGSSGWMRSLKDP